MELVVVRRTDRYVVVDKPSGMLSVRGKGPGKEDCVPARVLKMIPEATGPMVVHRLDMDTSGLMVVGLDAWAQRDLSLQFERRKTIKRYVALLAGHVPHDLGGVKHDTLNTADASDWPVVDCPIRLDPENRPYQVHDPVHGKSSQTRYRLGEHGWLRWSGERRAVTRVEFEPITGRSHQLRVHAALPSAVGGLGFPIIGDPLYGVDSDREGPGDEKRDAGDTRLRLMLHAYALGFTEPGTDRWVVCRSDCDWDALFEPA